MRVMGGADESGCTPGKITAALSPAQTCTVTLCSSNARGDRVGAGDSDDLRRRGPLSLAVQVLHVQHRGAVRTAGDPDAVELRTVRPGVDLRVAGPHAVVSVAAVEAGLEDVPEVSFSAPPDRPNGALLLRSQKYRRTRSGTVTRRDPQQAFIRAALVRLCTRLARWNCGTASGPAPRIRIRTTRAAGLRNLPLHGAAQNQAWLEIVQFALGQLARMPLLTLTGIARLWGPAAPYKRGHAGKLTNLTKNRGWEVRMLHQCCLFLVRLLYGRSPAPGHSEFAPLQWRRATGTSTDPSNPVPARRLFSREYR